MTDPLTPAATALQRTADILADAASVARTPVLAASMRTRRAAPNAFVAGLGPLRRIVVLDSLLDSDPSHVRAVLAHEVGPVRHRDIARRLALVASLNLATPAVLAALGSGGIFGWFRGGDWSAAADPAFACVAAVIAACSYVVVALVARRQERAADRFALDITGDPIPFGHCQVDLNPRVGAPVRVGGLASSVCSHPPVAERMAAAEQWALDKHVLVT